MPMKLPISGNKTFSRSTQRNQQNWILTAPKPCRADDDKNRREEQTPRCGDPEAFKFLVRQDLKSFNTTQPAKLHPSAPYLCQSTNAG